MKHIGFTGTRQQICQQQLDGLKRVLSYLKDNLQQISLVFHHGDCLGADKAAHYLAERLGYCIHVHPPTNGHLRARCVPKTPGKVLPVASYHQRNLDIVWASSLIIACPNEMQEIVRSGTWSTVRLARKHNRPRIVVYPDGSIAREGLFTQFSDLT